MALDIEFALVCRKRFAELTGESDLRRYCDFCKIEVINLDALDDEARLELFEKAANSSARLCVSATVPPPGGRTCPGIPGSPFPPTPVPTAGLPVLPKNLEEERKRLRQNRGTSGGEERAGFFSKLKFW